MNIYILTIFPDMVREIMSYGVVGQAVKKGILTINAVDLRDFATDKHRSVDDTPFGGGPGMVMRVDIVDRALSAIKRTKDKGKRTKGIEEKIVLLSPQGEQFDQQKAEEYSKLDHLILISGRYEGVDERVREHLVDETLSIGPYVLSGGEIPAMAVADAVARLIPGVVGDPDSLVNESFSSSSLIPTFDFPHYTQPAEYRGWKVPDVLRSGNHEKIKKWREKHEERFTLSSTPKTFFQTDCTVNGARRDGQG